MTSPAVKLDENLGATHVALVRHAGYGVDRVHDEGLFGQDDQIVWQHACVEGRFFITLDLDFSDVRRYPPGSHPGLLLLRPRTRSRGAVAEVLARVLRERRLETLAPRPRTQSTSRPAEPPCA